MQKRTTITLDRELYEELVSASVAKYGDTKHISTVLNERLRERKKDHTKLLEMAKRTKTNHLTEKEIEDFRSDLSRRFEK
ncbi:MAG: hypothetical protein ACYCSO_00380 [Cuniculiplasma sp.]